MARTHRFSDPVQKEMQRLSDLGHEQLDLEMKEVFAEKSSLIASFLLNEMALRETSFEDEAVKLCRGFLKNHQARLVINAGMTIQKDLDEHTVTGED